MEPDLCLCLQVSSMSPTEQTWIRRKQTDAEIEPCDADLLSDDVGGPDVRLEEGALAETDDCELVFESVNHMFPEHFRSEWQIHTINSRLGFQRSNLRHNCEEHKYKHNHKVNTNKNK